MPQTEPRQKPEFRGKKRLARDLMSQFITGCGPLWDSARRRLQSL